MSPARDSGASLALLDSPKAAALFEKARIAAVGEPGVIVASPVLTERVEALRLVVPALVVLCLFTWWFYRGSWSPWLALTGAAGIEPANPVTGSASLYNGDFCHPDTLRTLRQMDWIKGIASSRPDPLDVGSPRVGYAVLGNLLTLCFSSYVALAALNLGLYGFCAWLAAQTAETLFPGGKKSLFAAGYFVLSVAATVHVGDLSGHLLGIAFFYLWTLLLVRMEVEGKSLTWRRTIGLSALLGAWSLTSLGAVLGLALFGALAIKRRKIAHVVLPAVVCLGLPQLQLAVLAHLGFALPSDLDADLAWRTLAGHARNLSADPANYCRILAVEVANTLFNDNPLVVVVAVVGLGFLRHRAKWLLAACYFLPIAGGLLFVPTAARGSAVAGNTIVLFSIVAHVAVEAYRRLRGEWGMAAALAPIIVLLGVQAAWGHAAGFGWLYPSAAYRAGLLNETGILVPAEFARMTGPLDENPTMIGGTAPATTFLGLRPRFGKQPVFPAARREPYRNHWSGVRPMLLGLAVQVPALACALAAALVFVRRRRGAAITVFVVGWISAAQVWGAGSGLDPTALRTFGDRIAIHDDERLVGRIQLSREFRERLAQAADKNRSIEISTHARGFSSPIAGPCEFQVDEWTADEGRLTISAQTFLQALATHGGRVEFSISPKAGVEGLQIHSWQTLRRRRGPARAGAGQPVSAGERQAYIVRRDGSREPIEWFPSFEIRVIRGDGAISFGGPGRLDHPPSAGYALIGF